MWVCIFVNVVNDCVSVRMCVCLHECVLCVCLHEHVCVCGERRGRCVLGRRKWSWRRRRICFRKRIHTKGTLALYTLHTEACSFSFFTFSRPCLMQYDTVPWHKGVTKTERTWHLLLFCGFPFSINLWQSVWERLGCSCWSRCSLLSGMIKHLWMSINEGSRAAFCTLVPWRLLGGLPGIDLVLCETHG